VPSDPDLDHALATVLPDVNGRSAQRNARIGEVRHALTAISIHSQQGRNRILFDIQYSTTIDELSRRGFELELSTKHAAWEISWEEDPVGLAQMLEGDRR